MWPLYISFLKLGLLIFSYSSIAFVITVSLSFFVFQLLPSTNYEQSLWFSNFNYNYCHLLSSCYLNFGIFEHIFSALSTESVLFMIILLIMFTGFGIPPPLSLKLRLFGRKSFCNEVFAGFSLFVNVLSNTI